MEKFKVMGTKYSRTEFKGYTHRFIIEFRVSDDWRDNVSLTLFSNSSSYQKLDDYINEKRSDKVISFEIIHRATKEQDEMASKLIEDFFKNL